jgi:hypothetical protein
MSYRNYLHKTHPLYNSGLPDMWVYLEVLNLESLHNDIKQKKFYWKSCCICMSKTHPDDTGYTCECCNDGVVCRDCWNAGREQLITRYHSPTMRVIIRCPVCRDEDWKEWFGITLSHHFTDMPGFETSGGYDGEEYETVPVIN